MQASLERYLKSKAYPKSIIRDREFLNSRKVLEGKARKLREQGEGKRPNRSRSLTTEEEEVPWQNSQLGGGTPRALLNTMWWLLTQHFGRRGRQEHHQMKVENFTLQRDDDGNEFLTFAEGPTKTRQGGVSVKTRLVTPKMFATGNEERCPAMLFKRYLGRRPGEMKKSGSFYLTVIDKPVSSVWYKKTTPMGKNTINTIMKNVKENSPLKDLWPEKNWTNHSAMKKNRDKEAEKFWYPEVWNKEYCRPHICQRAWRLRLRRRTRAADHFTSHWQHWSCSFKRRFKSTLSYKFHCIFVRSWPCLQFQSMQRHLEHLREWCRSEEHKWSKARIQAYLHRRIRFWVIWKRFERFNFVWKSTNFIFSKLKVC